MKDLDVLRVAIEALERDLRDPRQNGGPRVASGKKEAARGKEGSSKTIR